jgi:hypothetical protein
MIQVSKRIAAVALAAAFGAGLFTHIDIFPKLNTYGVSIGTDNHYCYVEYAKNSIDMGCEAAQNG